MWVRYFIFFLFGEIYIFNVRCVFILRAFVDELYFEYRYGLCLFYWIVYFLSLGFMYFLKDFFWIFRGLYMLKVVLNGEVFCKVLGSSVDLEVFSSFVEFFFKICKEGFRFFTFFFIGFLVSFAIVWTGSVVLALLLLAVFIYRLWKCCR